MAQYSENELRDFFYEIPAPEKMDEMWRQIREDEQSLEYLEYLEQVENCSENPVIFSEEEIGQLGADIRKTSQWLAAGEQKKRFFPKEKPDQTGFGQIYAAKPPLNWPDAGPEIRFVVIVSGSAADSRSDVPVAEVVPVSFAADFVSEHDLRISAEESVFNEEILLRFDEMQCMLAGQLSFYYGNIPDTFFNEMNRRIKFVRQKQQKRPRYSEDRPVRFSGADFPKFCFTRYEHRMNACLHQPAARLLNLKHALPGVTTFDLSHFISLESLLQEKEILEQAEGSAVIRLAADTLNSHEVVLETVDSNFLILDESFCRLSLRMKDPNLYLCLESDADYPITLNIAAEKEVLFRNVFPQNAELSQRLCPVAPASRFLNRILHVSINSDGIRIEKNVLLYHHYLREADNF